MRHTTLFVTIAITACVFAIGCGGGFKVGPSGWAPTDTGWRGNASVEFAPVDDIGLEGKAAVIVERDGDQFTATVPTVIDGRSVSIVASWGRKVEVASCYDGPETLPEVCTVVTPAANGEDGQVCVTLGGVALPCYVLPAGEGATDGDGEQGSAEPVSNPDEFGAPADGGYPDATPIIDAASITPSNPDPVGGSQPVIIPRAILADAGADG